MEYRAQVRRTRCGFDAWTPDIPGCAANGATEAEALSNLKHAIEGRLDLERLEDPAAQAIERTVSVELPEVRLAKAERLAAIEPAAASPFPPFLSFAVGGSLFGLGLTGVLSFILIEPTTSPVVFFGSAILAAFGGGGILMGLITMDSQKRSVR